MFSKQLWTAPVGCPLKLCSQLCDHLSTAPNGTESDTVHDQQTIQLLKDITTWLKNNTPHEKVLVAVGGRGGCAVQCLTASYERQQYVVARAALQSVYALVKHLHPAQCSESSNGGEAVAVELQQLVTTLLQTQQRHQLSTGGAECAVWLLRVLEALLVGSPRTLLTNTVITACRPYLFYGLAAYRAALQQPYRQQQQQEDYQQHTAMLSSDYDQANQHRGNYNNRNRRKRLRRKKTQPALSRSPTADLCSGGSRNRFASFITSPSMPLQLRPPASQDLDRVSLKPEWAKPAHSIKLSVQNSTRSSCTIDDSVLKFTHENSNVENKFSSENKIHFNNSNISASYKSDLEDILCHESHSPSVFPGSLPSPVDVPSMSAAAASLSIGDSPLGLKSLQNSGVGVSPTVCLRVPPTELPTILPTPILKPSGASLEQQRTHDSCPTSDDDSDGRNGSNIGRTVGSSCATESSNTCTASDWDDQFSPTEHTDTSDRVWSKSLLSARVRLCALTAVNALMAACGSNKSTLWVPLLCQAPSLLVCLIEEPQTSVRHAALQTLTLLLTDARQMLACATDRDERAAYSGLGQQLGSSVKELHRVLLQVLVSESNTDGIVRTLKLLELLIDNLTYVHLTPGLLTAVTSTVRPYVSHSEAVVRASALSLIVCVLLVKPALPEVSQLLLRYAAPTSATALHQRNSPQEHDAIVTSGEDMAADLEEEEGQEELEESSLAESSVVITPPTNTNATTTTTAKSSSRSRAEWCSRRTVVGWLLGQCVDSLLPQTTPARGVYVQVQLQSLKVLTALVSDHFPLVYTRLGVIQRVIAQGCTPAHHAMYGNTRLQHGTTESGVVVEHMYPLLGALLGLLKKECDALHHTTQDECISIHSYVSNRDTTITSTAALAAALATETDRPTSASTSAAASTSSDGNNVSSSSAVADGPLPNSLSATDTSLTSNSALRASASQLGVVPSSSIDWDQLSATLWLWALQVPLRDLLMLPAAADRVAPQPQDGVQCWVLGVVREGEPGDMARRQLVAASNVLTLITNSVLESIGDTLLNAILDTVLWLTNHPQSEVSVWGVRVCGVLCGHSGIQRSVAVTQMITAAISAGTALLHYGPTIGIANNSEESVADYAATVNKHRLVAVSALANVAAALKEYRLYGLVLPVQVVEALLRAAVHACRDKSKIKPHGVRCLGSCLGWLRDEAYEAQQSTHSRHHQVLWSVVDAELVSACLSTLVDCCRRGSNMKMRWNACHALHHLLHCPLPLGDSQQWRGEVLELLCSLVSEFHNYKVRIHACGALCSQPTRELYGDHYRQAWKALLHATNSTQNVADYLEMRHRDDLVCQVVQGMWRLVQLISPVDAAWLQRGLVDQQSSVKELLQRAHACLPPHCWQAAEQARLHLNHIHETCEALTDAEMSGLQCVEQMLLTPTTADTAAPLQHLSLDALAAPSTKTRP